MGNKIFLKVLLCTYTLTTTFAQENGFPPGPDQLPSPIIKKLSIHSQIKYTYAKTLVSSKILNPAEKAQEVNFKVILPEEAFITGLVMTIKGKSYDAYVKGKEEAKKDYDAAVSSGQGAAHVFQDNTRNSKDFTVAINVEPQEKVSFNLTYEELLSRKNRTYKNEINVNPHQIVKDLSIVVDIEDKLDIINVRCPEFKMSNEIDVNEKENKEAKKTVIAPNKVRVEWSPTVKEQTELSKDGLNGQMLVKYDVDATKNSQQILVDTDGYFVHILRNDDLPVLNKHVVFVLDVSGSMFGKKLEQVKDAMEKILQDLSEGDLFSIVLFSIKVIAWGPKEGANLTDLNSFDDLEPANVIAKEDYVIPVTKSNIEEALKFIQKLDVYGGTNIMGGLRNGLKLAKLGKSLNNDASNPRESMVIFLTDGQPNSEESNPDKITENVERDNKGVTIFSLGFGFDADMNFLKKVSLANGGFGRLIYADSDASLQLQNFYKEVASPVLSDVKFEYLPDQVENTTSDNFKNLFSGSDLLVLGKVKPQGKVSGALVANTKTGIQKFLVPIDDIILLPPMENKTKATGYLEKMWAYKTIKTLLDKNTISKNDSIEEKAKDLALKYSFVTPLTSLVIVKPNDSAVVNDEKKEGSFPMYGAPAAGFGGASNALIDFRLSKKKLLRGRSRGHLVGGAQNYGPSFSVSRFPAAVRPMMLPAGTGQPAPPPAYQQGFGAGGYPGHPPALSQLPASAGYFGHPPASPQGPAISSSIQSLEMTVVDAYPSTPLLLATTTVVPPHNHQLVDYSLVSWLNQTQSDDGLFLQPPSSLGTDVIALNQTDVISHTCPNGNSCKHFIHCVLDEFVNDVAKFTPYQCHIDPKFLGVCCPL